jgi:cytoskeletal protein CcmA (bactofilin family)
VNPDAASGDRKRDVRTGASAQFLAREPATSTINEALVITGCLTSKGNLHVNGRVEGSVRCHLLVLGETCHVEGDVVADEVVIHGRLIGSVHAQGVVLRSGCYVEGDLYHENLTIEQGVHFQGQSCRVSHPSSPSKTDELARDSA